MRLNTVRARWLLLARLLATLPQLLMALVFLAGGLRGMPPVFAIGDYAVLELYTRRASQGELLLGPYSRFGWNHPGPTYFYMLLPFYQLSGHNTLSLQWGALAINLAATLGILLVAYRMEDKQFAYATAVLLAMYSAYLGPVFLVNPWNPFVTVLPFTLVILLCAALANGHGWALPIMAGVSSFLAQTHIAYLPSIAAMGALSLLLYVAPGVRGRIGLSTRPRGRPILWLALAALVASAMWLPTIVEEIKHDPGNLARLYQFFTTSGQTHGLSESLFVLAENALVWLVFPARLVSRIAGAEAYHVALLLLLALQLGLLGGACLAAARQQKGHSVALCLLGGLGFAVALWSTVHIRGRILPYLVVWTSAVGLMQWAAIASVLVAVPGVRIGGRNLRWPGWLGQALGIMLLLLATATSITQVRNQPAIAVHAMAGVDELQQRLRAYLNESSTQRPLIRIRSAWPEAAGVVLQLNKQGEPLAIEESWIPMFGSWFSPTGQEDREIIIGDESLRAALRERLDYYLVADNAGIVIYALAGPRAISHQP